MLPPRSLAASSADDDRLQLRRFPRTRLSFFPFFFLSFFGAFAAAHPPATDIPTVLRDASLVRANRLLVNSLLVVGDDDLEGKMRKEMNVDREICVFGDLNGAN